MNGIALLVPPTVWTVTFLVLRLAKPAILKVAVTVVEFTTVMPVTVMPPPLTAMVVPVVVKLLPVSVTANALPPRAWSLGVIDVSVGGGGVVTVKFTVPVVIPPVVTLTALTAGAVAVAAMVKVAVIDVGLETVTLLTEIPLPAGTFTVDPSVEKLVPVRVTDTLLPRTPVFGAIEVSVGGGTDVPLSDTGEPPIAALPVSVNVPSAVPTAGLGAWNTTMIVQLEPAAKVAPHDPPDRAKETAAVLPGVVFANARVIPFKAAAPVGFVRVKVCVGFVP